MRYDKLVRDKIPDIVKGEGKKIKVRVVENNEYFEKLKEKMVEESSEYLISNETEELADVIEIIYAILDFKGITKEELEAIRVKKAGERGAFKQKIILEEIS